MAAAQANDRLKARFGSVVGRAMVASVAVHFVILAAGPRFAVAGGLDERKEVRAVDVAPHVEPPPPPEELARPAVPIVGDMELAPDLTIAPQDFTESAIAPRLEPPTGTGSSRTERFTPYEVRPELRNAADFLRALRRAYPPMLRDAGVGGTTELWVHVDERGEVLAVEVNRTSGYAELDSVAGDVMMEIARFRPALNRDQRVAVWVQIPVIFESR